MRVAVLPAEFKESAGEDVRNVLRRADGRDQVLQAISGAQPWEPQKTDTGSADDRPQPV